ncbi:MAG: purine-nucleoside phosphorylase [Flavisolibacter sp.]
MEELPKKIKQAVDYLKGIGFADAKIGIVLGTGLGSFTGQIDTNQIVAYEEIPNFPIATVEFHSGKLILGTIATKRVIVMQGRFHYYEGYSMQQITFPIRVMKELGVRHLLLSNAAGGIKLSFKKADLVLIDDHINLLPENPLRGLNDSIFGNRFVDMSAPYSGLLNDLLFKTALQFNIKLKKGVYVSVMGPNLETRAEYRYLKIIGADMVGMSTVPEVIVAGHLGIECAAVSVITDECDPDQLKPVNIKEIIEVAGRSDKILSRLFLEAIKQL